MPRNRKFFPHKSVLFVTTRTEVGLPFVSSLIMNFILWGILAKAKEAFKVKVCHFVFMANHFHILLVVEDPQDVSRFMGYVKAESAHALNRLLGRKQRTVWQDGYDSPVVLSAKDAMECIRYIYINPVKACLVESISEFPGVSSWSMFSSGVLIKTAKRLFRRSIKQLESDAPSINEQKRVMVTLERLPAAEHVFELEPDAWMDCFNDLKGKCRREVNSQLIEEINQEERSLAKKRRRENKNVLGVTTLRRESMSMDYVPSKHGQRMICRCFDKQIRRAFISTFRALCDKARRVYESWCRGDLTLRMPPGILSPSVPALSSALPLSI